MPEIDFGAAGFDNNYNAALGVLANEQINSGVIPYMLQNNQGLFVDLAHGDFSGSGTNDAWLKAESMIIADDMNHGMSFADARAHAESIVGTDGNRSEAGANAARGILGHYGDSIGNNNNNDRLHAFPNGPGDQAGEDHDFVTPLGNLVDQLVVNTEFLVQNIVDTFGTGNIATAVQGAFIFLFNSAVEIAGAFMGACQWAFSGIVNFFGWENGEGCF